MPGQLVADPSTVVREHKPETTGYRADIDGLRALAVIPVVLYHAGVRGFSGGFVGVDVFFVISGYLITGILVRDVAVGRHSIAEFYRRRILRIFPALFAMFLAVTIVATMTMLPSELRTYTSELAAAALFFSNVKFYLASGYFGAESAVKPLLHTWSLAIEEQWYIVWPLVIAFVSSRRPKLLRPLTVVLVMVSFGICLWQTRINQESAFYLLPSRAWELGLGAVLSLVSTRASNRWLLEIFGFAGVALILGSVKVYTHDTSFPGLAALAPCLGAALLIYSGASRTIASRALSTPPMQFIGKISYSLYLWHWPVMVFAKLGFFLQSSAQVALLEIVLSLVLATISWRFVEMPFRHKSSQPTRLVLGVGGVAIVVLVGFSFGLNRTSEKFRSLTEKQTEIASYLSLDGDALYRKGECFAVGPRARINVEDCLAIKSSNPTIAFIGDSHAAALWPGLSLYRDEFNILQATATGCVAKLYPLSDDTYCASVLNGVLRNWLRENRPDALLFASRWKWRTLPGLEETLSDSIVRANHPILIGPIPEYSAPLPRLMLFAELRQIPALVENSLDRDVFAIDSTMRKIAARTQTPYISLVDILCDSTRCVTSTPSGAPLQFDYGHLTSEGSALVVERILPSIKDVIRQ